MGFVPLAGRRLGGDEAAGPQAPKPARPADAFGDPSLREEQILYPAIPCRFAEIAGAVAAPSEVDQQHAPPACRERARRDRDHTPRLVHFLRERVDVQHGAARSGVRTRPVKDAKASAPSDLGVERLQAYGSQTTLGAQLALDEATSVPTVAKVDPSISSSSTTNANFSSSAAITETTAIESSSGIAPRSGVLGSNARLRPCRLGRSPTHSPPLAACSTLVPVNRRRLKNIATFRANRAHDTQALASPSETDCYDIQLRNVCVRQQARHCAKSREKVARRRSRTSAPSEVRPPRDNGRVNRVRGRR